MRIAPKAGATEEAPSVPPPSLLWLRGAAAAVNRDRVWTRRQHACGHVKYAAPQRILPRLAAWASTSLRVRQLDVGILRATLGFGTVHKVACGATMSMPH